MYICNNLRYCIQTYAFILLLAGAELLQKQDYVKARKNFKNAYFLISIIKTTDIIM